MKYWERGHVYLLHGMLGEHRRTLTSSSSYIFLPSPPHPPWSQAHRNADTIEAEVEKLNQVVKAGIQDGSLAFKNATKMIVELGDVSSDGVCVYILHTKFEFTCFLVCDALVEVLWLLCIS